MSQGSLKVLFLTAALLLASAVNVRAQQNDARLTVATADGQTTFHIGERIPLKLTFSSPNDSGFLISPVIDGERGEEFDCDKFQVSPATGWSDPLATYFLQNFMHGGHGWAAHPLLSAKPETATVDLNQWIRFDEPGDYKVTVSSRCVQRSSPPAAEELQASIKLQIVAATADWQAQKLRWIQAHLQRPDPLMESATRDLRYLATPAAVDEMTSQLRLKGDFISQQCSMGLDGLPESLRGPAIDSMKMRIVEPGFPVSPLFFSTMTFLHVEPGSDAESIRNRRSGWAAEVWLETYNAVEKKEPDAKAQTVQTLVADHEFTSSQVTARMGALLRGSFLRLDMNSQIEDLRAHWDELGSPDFLPVLRTLAEKPLRYTPRFGDFGETDLKSLAFYRWYALDPPGAHKEILTEIGSDEPTLPAQALSFLPPERMPTLEPVWLREFLGSRDQLTEQVFGSLLVRFGTGAAAKEMTAKLEYPGEQNQCDARVFVFAYLVRFTPELALPLLQNEMNRSGCGSQMLSRISELAAPAPVLERIALEGLNSADTSTAEAAVEYLKSYGSSRDETPLWRRYVRWSDANKDNAEALDHSKPGADPQMGLGSELASALLEGNGWFADNGLFAQVLARCVGKQMCDSLKDTADWAKPPYRIGLSDMSLPVVFGYLGTASVAQYGSRTMAQFDEKIAQYPRGSHFTIFPSYRRTGDELKLVDQVKAILTRHGMVLDAWKN